jgi:hypothetical protein
MVVLTEKDTDNATLFTAIEIGVKHNVQHVCFVHIVQKIFSAYWHHTHTYTKARVLGNKSKRNYCRNKSIISHPHFFIRSVAVRVATAFFFKKKCIHFRILAHMIDENKRGLEDASVNHSRPLESNKNRRGRGK